LLREQLEEVYRRFTALADRKKGVRNEEIVHIIQQVVGLAVAQ
jgi:hypothetical protein